MMEKTLGELRVRVDFNPDNNGNVDQIKQKTAELINLVEELPTADRRLVAIAQTTYEEAAMWAVKAATASTTKAVKEITFKDLVEHGLKNCDPSNIHNGMPWSFNYEGFSVTHENDDLYLIITNTGTVRFGRNSVLCTTDNTCYIKN